MSTLPTAHLNTPSTPAFIDAWRVIERSDPGEHRLRIAGIVTGHPFAEYNGRRERLLQDVEEELHPGMVVRTLNVWYVLGAKR